MGALVRRLGAEGPSALIRGASVAEIEPSAEAAAREWAVRPASPALLWRDPAPHRRRREKTAAALVAVRDALARHRPFGGGEAAFLSTFEWLAAAPPGPLAPVLAEPGAYHWVRTAFELVATVVGGAELSPLARARCRALACRALAGNGPGSASESEDTRSATGGGAPPAAGGEPAAALAEHLDSIAALAVGVAAAGRLALELPAPWRPRLPHAFLGTAWVLEAPDGAELEVLGVAAGDLLVRAGGERRRLALSAEGASAEGVGLRGSAVARHGGFALRLQPEAFLVPDFEPGAMLAELPPGYQREHEGLVAAALARIERYAPDAWRELAAGLRVAAVKPEALGGLTNLSHSELPGAAVLSVVRPPELLADSIVHEVYHGRLFALEEVAPLFAPEDAAGMLAEEHYSPWRDDPRPLHGILHAVYVHVPVWRFWASVREDTRAGSARRLLADDRLARVGLQLEVGLATLRHRGRLSHHGARIVAALAREVERIRRERLGLGVGAATPAVTWEEDGAVRPLRDPAGAGISVGEELLAHARRVAPGPAEREVEAALARTAASC